MAFKMKGAPYPPNRKGKINPNSEGNTDLKDGRSMSAAFQYSSPVKQTEDSAEYVDPAMPGEEDEFMKNVEELGLTQLLEEEGESFGTYKHYTDKDQAAIDELNRRMREFEDNPK